MKLRQLFPLVVVVGFGQGSLKAQEWTLTPAPVNDWRDLAISAEGAKVAAAAYNGPVYVSTNAATTWQPTGLSSASALACSADGQFLAAAAGGQISVSTNWGATWQETTALLKSYRSIACSSDGTRVVAASYVDGFASTGEIYASTNSGLSWVKLNAPLNEPFRAVTCSADGSQIVAATRGEYIAALGLIYRSTDYGATWSPANSEWRPWCSTCSSASGGTLVAIATDGASVSRDSGVSWSHSDAWYPGTPNVACSADGSVLAVAAEGLPIQVSVDFGAAWNAVGALATNWCAVACSADGSRLVAAVRGGGVYTWQSTPQPLLAIEKSGSNVRVSWATPSMPFVLQQTASLTEPEWSGVDTQPALNYTNLNQEVSLPAPKEPVFYRLISR